MEHPPAPRDTPSIGPKSERLSIGIFLAPPPHPPLLSERAETQALPNRIDTTPMLTAWVCGAVVPWRRGVIV